MKTVSSHTERVRAKILIAFRRAISAYDVNLGVWAADSSGGIREKVKQARVKAMHFSGAVIAEKMVELRQSLGYVGISAAVNNIQMLTSMSMIEA